MTVEFTINGGGTIAVADLKYANEDPDEAKFGQIIGGTETAEDDDPVYDAIVGFKLSPFRREIDLSYQLATRHLSLTLGLFAVVLDKAGNRRTLLNHVRDATRAS